MAECASSGRFIVSIAKAAGIGFRNAALEEVHRAEASAVAQWRSGRAPPSHAMIIGLLLLSYAEIAAAEGVLIALQVAVCLVPPVAQKLLSNADLLLVQTAIATGAATIVRGRCSWPYLPRIPWRLLAW